MSGAELLTPPRRTVVQPALIEPNLTLAAAVGLALRHNPAIAQARFAVAAAEGRLKEQRGRFDLLFTLTPGYAYLQQELLPALITREDDKRSITARLAQSFASVNRQVGDQLASLTPRAPVCPAGLQFGLDLGDFFIERRDPNELALFGFDQDFRAEDPLRIVNNVILTRLGPIPLIDLCRPPDDPDLGGAILDVYRRLSRPGGFPLDAVIDGLGAFQRDALDFSFELSEAFAKRLQQAYERLGVPPRDEVRQRLFIETGVARELRNGLAFRVDFRLESEERNFKGKPLDPSFGALEIRPRFPSFLTGTLDIPLGKGRGRVSAGAFERAAELSLQAQRDQLRATISEEVFRTVLAYLNLQAGQQAVALLQESETRQQRLLAATRELARVAEIERMQVDRSQAGAAAVTESLESARISVLEARLALAQAMGVDVSDLSRGPVASEALAESPPAVQLPSTTSLLQLARKERPAPRALRLLGDASRALAAAATAELAPRIDLSIAGGFSTLYESPFLRFVPDEVHPIFSDFEPRVVEEEPARYYSYRGFARTLAGEWKPFVKAAVSFDLPFGNRAARGRVEQARAAVQRSEVESADLERLIENSVVNLTRVLGQVSQTAERRREAVVQQQRSLDAALEQFQNGDLTLLDTLVTEEDLTASRLQLLRDVQGYMSALARLKYETGTLVVFDRVSTPTETIRFPPLDRLSR
jgi:outer membrane protein TolC